MFLNDCIHEFLLQTSEALFAQNGSCIILAFKESLSRTAFAHVYAAPVTEEPLFLFLCLFEIVTAIVALLGGNSIQVRLFNKKDGVCARQIVLSAQFIGHEFFRVNRLMFDWTKCIIILFFLRLSFLLKEKLL